jgi:hypothetical protein
MTKKIKQKPPKRLVRKTNERFAEDFDNFVIKKKQTTKKD